MSSCDLHEPLMLDSRPPSRPPSMFNPKRRHIYTVSVFLAAFSVVVLMAFGVWTFQPMKEVISKDAAAVHISDPSPLPQAYLNGPPTSRFRDNLRPDYKYITSWISAGWTNDVMTYINLIYLGMLTERIPIVATFVPSHIGGNMPHIQFGKVFDVPRLSKLIGTPVLEWHHVKNETSDVYDEIGCWNVFESTDINQKKHRDSVVPDMLKLDISYTKTPSWVKLIPRFKYDSHALFWSLASLAFPETRADSLMVPLPSPSHNISLPPDEHLLCYDYLYYVCAHQPYEFDFDYSPAWRFVGQHLHWVPELEKLAHQYIKISLDIQENEPIPPWIAVHVRHGDFKDWCGQTAIVDCFASLEVIGRRVDEVKAEVLERRGIAVNHIIMTSDERDPIWWDAVKQKGWYPIDHSDTAKLHGAWYPVLIDAVIQAGGIGFVGTDRSTMSTLARRRVQSWQNGIVRTVKWGKPDSDRH